MDSKDIRDCDFTDVLHNHQEYIDKLADAIEDFVQKLKEIRRIDDD